MSVKPNRWFEWENSKMDLLDFEAESLYFEDKLSEEVNGLLDVAAETYGDQSAEHSLMRAYFLEPEHLTVLVALYRYFYYQHRYPDAFLVAERAMDVAARRLEFRLPWQQLTLKSLGVGVMKSMTLTRFYLMALKGAGYLKLRMGETQAGLERLEKVAELDVDDRLGVDTLVELARDELRRQELSAHPNVISI
jgi:tetratricopeptide (TPR) repeat protein